VLPEPLPLDLRLNSYLPFGRLFDLHPIKKDFRSGGFRLRLENVSPTRERTARPSAGALLRPATVASNFELPAPQFAAVAISETKQAIEILGLSCLWHAVSFE
jgi:hypothetical protein